MNPRSPLARHQIRRLDQLRALGACTDESLAAYLREVGEPCDRTTLVRYRAGERTCPIGLLDLALGHVDDPAAVLDLWARDHGLHVVPEVDPDALGSVPEEAGDLTVALGRLIDAAHRREPADVIADLARAVVREAEDVAAAARRGAA